MLSQRRVRIVKGPARVTVSGECFVLGAKVSNSVVAVRAGKALPFEPGPGSRLFISRGARSRTWSASPAEAGTAIWSATAQLVFDMVVQQPNMPFRVMVVGESDSGKSTMCTYLSNLAVSRGYYPVMIDGDIGQGDIAPPCAAGAAALRSPVTDLRDATATMFEFVGRISAAGAESEIASCLGALCRRSKKLGNIQIINTDGYVHDLGVSYKKLIAEQVKPDVIVCIGKNAPLESALSERGRVLSARSSGQTLKSSTERRWRRYDQYLRFAGNKRVLRTAGDLQFYFFGRTIRLSGLGTLPLISETGGLPGLFVGLGEDRTVSGFGIIRRAEGNEIEFQTETGRFDTVFLSKIRITGTIAEQISE
jgi:polynucleotide 5'-hydroxyl-kinase GRC3/NOL9